LTSALPAAAPATFAPEDARHMARALQLAARGRCTTWPNPRVGCVLVRDGEPLAEGWHRQAGGPHAEVAAIAAAGGPAATRGATAYVTLEPCNHHGRTPPCVDALLAAGVVRVVAALLDPDPRMAGQGLARLAAHGVQVASGLMADAAERLNRGYLARIRRGRPFLTLKLAQSLDGRIALASGASRWLTGPAARRDVHRRRAECDVILTGIGTVLADDPSLTVREGFEAGILEQPLRVVVDSRQRLPATARLATDGGRTLLVHADAPESAAAAAAALQLPRSGAGPLRWSLPGPDGRVDLSALLGRLAACGCNEVFAECGGTLAGALVDAGLVDELLLYVAPRLLGAEGRPVAVIGPRATLTDCPRWRIVEQRRFGADLCLVLVRDDVRDEGDAT
jgi:diaminohydroxyphosphoribosylaminopyrimidine deaminase/5-amino-6-(5-phosphoribosylamino)uracil reductase